MREPGVEPTIAEEIESFVPELTIDEWRVIVKRSDMHEGFEVVRRRRRKVVEDRLRGTSESWDGIRRRIRERDGQTCRVCGAALETRGECGHIIDRMCGGSDLDDNLMIVCDLCNHLKPPHATREAFEVWRAAGGGPGVLLAQLRGDGRPEGGPGS